MTGNFIDTFRCRFKKGHTSLKNNFFFISTDFGKIRVFDTKGNKPVIISVPDGPNVIEHHENLISKLSENFRVICFELPGNGFSYPNSKYDYSMINAAKLIVNVLDIMKVERATLAFSCSNGFYAIKTAEIFPDRVNRLFLSQTPSLHSMGKWTENTIPGLLKYPVIGQIVNSIAEKKLVKRWYKKALPKMTDKSEYQNKALNSINNGGCFCLSGLVQGLSLDLNSPLEVLNVPATLIWGNKDGSHRKTDNKSIIQHLPDCEIIEFRNCGHFPELEDTNRYVELLKEKLN